MVAPNWAHSHNIACVAMVSLKLEVRPASGLDLLTSVKHGTVSPTSTSDRQVIGNPFRVLGERRDTSECRGAVACLPSSEGEGVAVFLQCHLT